MGGAIPRGIEAIWPHVTLFTSYRATLLGAAVLAMCSIIPLGQIGGGRENPNEHEARLAAEMAAKLMAKHQIESSSLELGADPVEKTVIQRESKGKAVAWQVHLATKVGQALNVEVVYTPGCDRISAIGRS